MDARKVSKTLMGFSDDVLSLLGVTRNTIDSTISRYGFEKIGGYMRGIHGQIRAAFENSYPTYVFVNGDAVKNVTDWNIDDGWVLHVDSDGCMVMLNGVVTIKDYRSKEFE